MTPYRKTGVAVGVLFLTATITFMVGHTLVLGVLGGPQGPAGAAAEANALTTGTLLFFVDALAVVGIAFLVFPLLKRYSEPLALGYVGLRVGELAAILLLMAPTILLVPLSVASTPDQWALASGGVDASTLKHLLSVAGAQYRAAMALVFLSVGASGAVLSYVLIRSRLVPRPLAVLGAIGYLGMLLGTVLDVFELLDLQQGVGLFLVWPVGLFELVLPLWLFVKGFDTEAVGSSGAGEPRAGG